jgi:outer membrane protein assembly factor BamE (lipoprotein component of BamABCDE complex)
VTQQRIARTPGILSQGVVVLSFNDQGVLQEVKRVGQEDAVAVSVVARTTPSPGTEASFLQQLFGNIGRFNTFGASPSQNSVGSGLGVVGGGAPAPAY